jgi:hypothetical protein
VLDRAIKPIRSDKHAFGVLVNEAETMECSAQQSASTQRAPCLQMNWSKAAPRVANALCGFALKLRADAGTGAMAVATSFDAVHHQWRMQRRSRTFEVRVVEPHAYAPEKHGRLFLDVVNAILNPEPTRILKLGEYAPDPRQDTFDLVTFPEAFVPASTLAEVLSQLVGYAPLGCFHLGLRPSNDPTQHLFSRKELVALVDNLAAIAPSIRGDVGAFRPWLEAQSSKDLFNVGCLFGVDASGVVRVCLHPKLVASDLEISALPERTMREANLLTLVTLWPSEPQLLSVTVQPLLCSDALGLPTDRPGADPLEAVTSFAAAFGEHPPDHVDIVSVATCTPQPSTATERGTQREWHNRFRDAFRRTAEGPGCRRHRFAVFALANYDLIGEQAAGLSGVFLPVTPRDLSFPPVLAFSVWGRPKDQYKANNRWSALDDVPIKWDGRGIIAYLRPNREPSDAEVKIFGFSLRQMPREHSLWAVAETLSRCEVLFGVRDGEDRLRLERGGDSNG